MKETHTFNLNGCARCDGEGHPNITFTALAHPVYSPQGEVEFTHWAPCPVNGDPILLAFVDRPNSAD